MLFACIDMLCLCINIVLIFDSFVRCGDDDRITMIVDCRGRNRTIVNGRGNRNDVDGRARNPRIVDDRGIRAADR